jgi:nickel transport protein
VNVEFLRFTRPLMLLASLVLCLLPTMAHDLQTIVRMEGRFVVLEASYEGEEEASFISVSVHAPNAGPNADAFQKGRTDLRGHFTFAPDRPGEWKITVDDEMGHRATQPVMVSDAALSGEMSAASSSSPAAVPGGRSTSDKVIVGLSVLFGASGLLMAFLTRRRNYPPA